MWKSTERQKRYWQERKIDWEKAYFTPDHKHRGLIIQELQKIRFGSVFEIGCGAAANLHKILQAFPRTRVGGVDVNADAIEEAKKHLPRNAIVEARSAERLMMNDKSVDVTLSDACLIYLGPFRIGRVLKEVWRITRSHVLFVELHSPNFLERLKVRWGGYHIYDYKKLLAKHGFYDVQVKKIPPGYWDGTPWEKWGYVISARV